MKINEQWEEQREKSHANIQSERVILKRQTRSIQTEGHFGDIKENETLDSALRRFKRNCAKAGIQQEIRKREHYEKPSVRRKKKSEAARKRKYN